MKNKIKIIIALIFIVSFNTFSQFPERPFGPGPERIEKYKKLRLIEELNLSDEESIRFNRLYNAHMDSLREIRKALDDYQKIIEEYLQKAKMYQETSKEYEKYTKEMKKILREYEQCHKKYWDVYGEYIEKLKQLLTDEQLAKYYLFEKRFNKELREAIEKMREDMPRRRMR